MKRGGDYNLEDDEGLRPDDVAAIFDATDCQQLIISWRQDRQHKLQTVIWQVNMVETGPTDCDMAGKYGGDRTYRL